MPTKDATTQVKPKQPRKRKQPEKPTVTTDEYVRLSEYAQRQVDRAWKAYATLGAVLAVALTIAGLLLGSTYGEWKDRIDADMQEQLDEFKEEKTAEIKERMDKEFTASAIKSLIETSAINAVRAEATPIIVSNVAALAEAEIAPLREAASKLQENVSIARSEVASFHTMVTDINPKIRVLDCYFTARAGNRAAYTELLNLSEAEDTDIHSLAGLLTRQLQDEYGYFIETYKGLLANNALAPKAMYNYQKTYHPAAVASGKPIIPAGEKMHAVLLGNTAHGFTAKSCLYTVHKERYLYLLEPLITYVTTTDDLYAAALGSFVMGELTEQSFPLLPPYDKVTEWWTEKGSTNELYQSPFALIDKADDLVMEGRTSEALKFYEDAVLNRKGLTHTHNKIALLLFSEELPSVLRNLQSSPMMKSKEASWYVHNLPKRLSIMSDAVEHLSVAVTEADDAPLELACVYARLIMDAEKKKALEIVKQFLSMTTTQLINESLRFASVSECFEDEDMKELLDAELKKREKN